MRELNASELLRHRPFVRGLALSLTGEAESADDLTQEALLIGLERPPADPGALRAWLGQVVRRLAWRRMRSERARGDREARAHADAPDAGLELPASFDAARAETRHLLAQALEALDPIYRDVLVLRFYEGLPPREIALRLGVPLETVRTRQKRGLERLRARLDGRFRDREVWGLALLGLAGIAPRRTGLAGGLLAAAAVVAAILPLAWLGLRSRAAEPLVAVAPAPADAFELRALDAELPAPADAQRAGLEAAAAPAPAAESPRIGRVLTPLGQPAAGARVQFQWLLGAERAPVELETDAQGRFALPDDARAAVVCAWHEDWGTAGLLSAMDPMFEESFDLLLFHPWPHAEGRVQDEHGAPIAGARIALSVASEVGRTIAPRRWGVLLPEPFAVEADGTFAIPSVPLGTYWIRAEAPGFAPCAQVWTPVDSDARFDFVLVRGRSVEGRLTLRDGGPVAGARVELAAAAPHAPLVAQADALGRYRFEHVPKGELRATASWSDGDEGWIAARTLGCCADPRQQWDAELARGGAIRGWALRADEGVPEGWWVRAVAGARVHEAPLDEFGGFLITGWDAAHARLELRDRERRLRALAAWSSGTPDVELREAPGRLVGSVRFDDPRQAREALLLVRHVETEDELEARFDVELGRLDVDGLACGDWRLLRWLPGRRAEEVARYTVRAGETTDFGTLELPAMAHLAVDVGREPGGHVRLMRKLVDGSWTPEHERRVSQADAENLLHFEVQPAAYEVRIGGIASAARSYTTLLAPGERELLIPEPRELVDCVLRVQRPTAGLDGGFLDLRVVDPVLGVEVLLQRRPIRAATPRTVEFEVALPPGEWLLRASSPEGRVERLFRSDALGPDSFFELQAQQD
jgi:RNA polymerase sigma-70 factor (ECF subfamily)